MTEQNSAAHSRDRRRVATLAEKLQRAIASIDLMLDGLSPREKLVALHLALDRQLKIDKGLRHEPQKGSAGGMREIPAMDRSGRSGTAAAA
jgi:hypothetical protein